MNVRTLSLSALAAGAIVTATAATTQAVVIVSTDFNSATVQTYANATTINSGGVTTDDLLVAVSGAGNVAEVVNVATGDNAVRVTRPTNANIQLFNRLAQNAAWTAAAISTGATGNNQMAITFDINRLNTGGTAPNTLASGFRFLLSDADSSGGTANVQWEIQPTGVLLYRNGGSTVNTTTALALDTNYRVSINVDLSNTTQDTFSFKVTNLSTSVDLYNVTNVSTRSPNTIPNRVVFDWGSNSGSLVDADPAYLLDNVNVSAVPEPASMGLIGVAGLLALRRRRA